MASRLGRLRQNDRARARREVHNVDKSKPKLMPFGTHKGKQLWKLPIDYILWCLETSVNDDVRDMLTDELLRRAG